MKFQASVFVLALMSSASFAAAPPAPATTPSAAASTPMAAPSSAAPVTAAANAGPVTALCKDGTNFSGTSKKGACSGHKGVKTWTTAEEKTTPSAGATPVKADAKPAAPMAPAATGGGAGKVWLNTNSNTYHCQGDRYYGKTKAGSYLSEADAKAKGAHADHGKACS